MRNVFQMKKCDKNKGFIKAIVYISIELLKNEKETGRRLDQKET